MRLLQRDNSNYGVKVNGELRPREAGSFGQCGVLVRPREAAVADHIGDQDRGRTAFRMRPPLGRDNIEPPCENPCNHRTPSRPVVAKSGCAAVSPRTSAVGRRADLRGAMSACCQISSASPPGADRPGGAAIGPGFTQAGPRADITHSKKPRFHGRREQVHDRQRPTLTLPC